MACDPNKESCDWFDGDGLGLNEGNIEVTGLFSDISDYNDPWHWLPMTRWTNVNDFFYTNEGGISGFFLGAINSGIQTIVALLFALASFMWTLTVWIVRLMVGAPTLAAQFLSQMDDMFVKYGRAVISSGMGIAVIALACLAAIWAVVKGGGGRVAVRRIMASVLPIALIVALMGFSSDSSYVAAVSPDGRTVWVPESDELPAGYRRPSSSAMPKPQIHSMSGPEWLFATTLNLSTLISDPVLSFVDEVRSDTGNAPDQISTCDSYIAVLEGNFIRAWNTQQGPHFENADGSTGEVSALRSWATNSNRLRMRLAVLISRIWERSYAVGYGQAQFGDIAAAERAFCIVADWRTRDVTPLEQLAVWRETCELTSIPSLALGEFMPLAGCGIMGEIKNYDATEVQRKARWSECLEGRPARGSNIQSQVADWLQGNGNSPAVVTKTRFNEIVSVYLAPQVRWAADDAIEFMSVSRQAWVPAAESSIDSALGVAADRVSFVAGWVCYSSPPDTSATDWLSARIPALLNRWLSQPRSGGDTVRDWLSQSDVSSSSAEAAAKPHDANANFFQFLRNAAKSEMGTALAAPVEPFEDEAADRGIGFPLWRYSNAGGYATAVFSPATTRDAEGNRFQQRTFHGTWAMCDFTNWSPRDDGSYAPQGAPPDRAMSPQQMTEHTAATVPLYSSAGMITAKGTKLASWIPVPGSNGIVKVEPRALGLGGTRAGAKEEERVSAQACFAYLFGGNGIVDRDQEDHQADDTLTLGPDSDRSIGVRLPSGADDSGLWNWGGRYPDTSGYVTSDPNYPGSANDYVLHRLGRTPEEYRESASYVTYEIAPNSAHPGAATGFVQTDSAAGSAADIFESVHGRAAASKLILGLMAVFVAWAYLWSLSGLALGSALSIVILALVVATLPLTLLISALPFEAARRLPWKIFKLGIGAALSYTVFVIIITMILVVIDVLMDVVKAASVDSSELLYSLILGLVPLIAIKAVGAVSKQFGVDITKMKGAFQMTSGMAFAAMKPPVRDGRHYIDRGTRLAGAAMGGALGGAALGGELRQQPRLAPLAKNRPHRSAKAKATADTARGSTSAARALPSPAAGKKVPTATPKKTSTGASPDIQRTESRPEQQPEPSTPTARETPAGRTAGTPEPAPLTERNFAQDAPSTGPTDPLADIEDPDNDSLVGTPNLSDKTDSRPSIELPTPDRRSRVRALADFARAHPALTASGAVLATAGAGPAVAAYGLSKLAATSFVNVPLRLGRRLGLPVPNRRNGRWGDIRLAGRTAARVNSSVRSRIAQLRSDEPPPTDRRPSDEPPAPSAHPSAEPVGVPAFGQPPSGSSAVDLRLGSFLDAVVFDAQDANMPAPALPPAPITPHPQPVSVSPQTAQTHIFVPQEKLAERLDRINETLASLRQEQNAHNVAIATHLMPLERRLGNLRDDFREAAAAQRAADRAPRRAYNRINPGLQG